jgi:hypothetical protein
MSPQFFADDTKHAAGRSHWSPPARAHSAAHGTGIVSGLSCGFQQHVRLTSLSG